MKIYFKTIILLLVCGLSAQTMYAQIGGRQSFAFLRLPADARSLGLGGVNVSWQDADLNRTQANPALLRDTVANWASFNYMRWQASIDFFSLQYAPKLRKVGVLGFGLQVMNYGQMPLMLPNGIQQGTFKANDFVWSVSKSFAQRHFRYGGALKWIGSSVAGYNAMAVAVDIGGIFQHPKYDWTIGVAFKNMGFTFNNYTDECLNLPFEAVLGTTFKPQYMPFRFSLTYQHLQKWDIVYLDPAQSNKLDANGNILPAEKKWGDKLLRHFVLGSELLLSKKFHVLLSYNHLHAREMRLEDVGGLRGFAFGCRLLTSRWQFSFARGAFASRAGKNMLSLSTDLSKVLKRKVKNQPN